MPVDRFGNRVNIGWAEHEDLWIEAANTLPRKERHQAVRDIAELTSRTYGAVLVRAALFRANDRRLAKAAEEVLRQKESASLAFPAPRVAKYLGTDLRVPDKRELMGCR